MRAQVLRHAREQFEEIDAREFEPHGAGIDHGKIEKIARHVGERAGRGEDVVHIFALLRAQFTRLVRGEQFRKALHRIQRIAEEERGVVDEIGLEPVRGFQRFGAIPQRALDTGAIRHVGEGGQCCAVGERCERDGEDRLVAAFDLAPDPACVRRPR